MSTKLRIGFIGAGGNTRLRHLPGFKAIEGVELYAVANRSVESSRRVAKEFGIGKVFASWEEIIADPKVDAVCIGTWPNTHAEMTCAALAAGKSVLVEARMARNLVESQMMVDAAAVRPDLVAQIVPSPFTLNADEAIRSRVASGALGDLREIVVEHATGINADQESPFTWRHDHEISGVNTMALGICFEPLLRWIPGDATVLAADALTFTKQRLTSSGTRREVKIPESVSVLGRWANGALLRMHGTSVERGANRALFKLVGSAATLIFDANAQVLTKIDVEGTGQQIPLDNEPLLGWKVERQFVDAIRRGEPVRLTDFNTGRRYMEFTQSVWDAWSQSNPAGGSN